MPTAHGALVGPWKLRFWTIWSGQAVSLVGTALTQFVLIWWITSTTSSSAALSIAGVMALLPQALLGPLGGILADRFSRRIIMIVSDTISALCMVVLIWLFQTGQVQLWHIYIMMFIRSSMQAFQSPASTASTAMLVPDNWLERVAGLNQILQGLTTIAAAPLGALLLAFLPFQGALLVDVVTALLGVAPLLVFVVPQIQRTDTHESGLWSDFVIGARVVLHNRGLLLLFGLATLVVLAIMPTFTLMPLLVKEYFRGGVNDVAFLGSLSGVGIIAGSVLITVMPLFRRRIVTILVAFALSCALIACTALAPSSMLWLATIFWALSGLAFAAGNAPLLALIQKQVPNQVQGRVIAILGALMGLAAPVGLGLVALFSGVVGVRGIFIIGGLSAATLCLFGFAAPSLIRIEETAVRPE